MADRKKSKPQSGWKASTKNKIAGLLFVSPFLIGFLAFTLFPILKTVQYSFSRVKFSGKETVYLPVGLKNFQDVLFNTPDFRLQLTGYLKLILLLTPVILVFSVLLALLLNVKLKGRRFFRAIYFLPVILISGPMLKNLFQMEAFTIDGLNEFFVFQFLNEVLPGSLGSWWNFIVQNIVLCLWFSAVQTLIFLSGMQKMDGAVYEAAMVDGASAWQKFWKITMPTLKPFLLLSAIYTVVDLSTSSLNPVVGIVESSMYAADRGYGFAAAVSWCYFFIILVVVTVTFLVFGRKKKEKLHIQGTFRKTH